MWSHANFRGFMARIGCLARPKNSVFFLHWKLRFLVWKYQTLWALFLLLPGALYQLQNWCGITFWTGKLNLLWNMKKRFGRPSAHNKRTHISQMAHLTFKMKWTFFLKQFFMPSFCLNRWFLELKPCSKPLCPRDVIQWFFYLSGLRSREMFSWSLQWKSQLINPSNLVMKKMLTLKGSN